MGGFGRFLKVSLPVAAIALLALVLSSLTSGQGSCSAGSFDIAGIVLNSTFNNATTNRTMWNASVNISIYNVSFSQFGEPVKLFINQTNTSANDGSFNLKVHSGDGACFTLFTISVVAYNFTSWNALEIGPSLPPLPKQAFTAVLNGSPIYLQPAATLNITATNETHNISFSRIVFDDALGFPISEDFMTTVFNATIVVPRAKNFTIMMMRQPDFTSQSPFNLALPPQTVSVQNASNYSNDQFVIQIKKNLSFSMYVISGFINISGNTTTVNVTDIMVKLGLAGLIPPNADIQLPNAITINQTPGGGNHVANYSVLVMGSSSGIYQLLEFYAQNSTSTSTQIGENFAYFSNFSVTGNMGHNLTLKRLAGNYSRYTGFTNLNTSFIKVNISDSSGQPLQDAHIEVKVDNVGHLTYFPTFRYMVSQLSGGVINIPILNDSNATVHVFNRRYAPLKFKLNITNASREPNGVFQLTLNTFKPKKFHANGSSEDFSGAKAGQYKFIFMKNSAACNVFNASLSDCRLFNDDFDAGKFDPLKVMATGKVNLLMEINTTGVKVYFIGVDMLASGPPEASMSENSLKTTLNTTNYNELFKFGSTAPDIYDFVLVGMPYNQTLLNDVNPINFTIRELYDDGGNLVWNSSQHPNGDGIPSDWSDYNQSFFNSSTKGVPCSDAAGPDLTNATCYINTTTNYVWIKLPHFSDGSGGVQGDPDTTPPVAPENFKITSLANGNVDLNWTTLLNETGETYVIFRSASPINLSSIASNFTNYTFANGIINVSNITGIRLPESATNYTDNQTVNSTVYYSNVYYYAVAAVDAAGNLQNASNGVNISNSYNVSINDTVMPSVPANLTVTTSSSTVTVTWLNVTQDVLGGADFKNLTYYIYRSEANATSNINLSAGFRGANVSFANLSYVKSVGNPANSTTVTGLVKGTYHFAVVTVDDGGNVNLSVFGHVLSGGNYANISVTPDTSSGGGSSSSSSGGGGGGGGAATATEETTVSKKWDVLPVGPAIMRVNNEEISFKTLDFTVEKSKAEVELSVSKLDSRPSSVGTVTGKAYQYIRIDKVNLVDADVSEVKIEFKVERKWIDQNSGAITDVVLQRYSDDKWNSLPTVFKRSDATHSYFEATSPGFSVFAVVLKPKAAAAPAKTTSPGAVNVSPEAGNQSGNVTGASKGVLGGKSSALVGILVVAAIAAVGGAAFYISKKKGISLSDFFGKFKRGGGGGLGGASQPKFRKSREEEEAAEIVREYEQQQRSSDQRGKPPEAFN